MRLYKFLRNYLKMSDSKATLYTHVVQWVKISLNIIPPFSYVIPIAQIMKLYSIDGDEASMGNQIIIIKENF